MGKSDHYLHLPHPWPFLLSVTLASCKEAEETSIHFGAEVQLP